MTPADERRRLEILAEFARFSPGVSFTDVGIRIRLAPERDGYRNAEKRRYLRAIDREIRAARPISVGIQPLPRMICAVCAMSFGTPQGLLSHQRKAHP